MAWISGPGSYQHFRWFICSFLVEDSFWSLVNILSSAGLEENIVQIHMLIFKPSREIFYSCVGVKNEWEKIWEYFEENIMQFASEVLLVLRTQGIFGLSISKYPSRKHKSLNSVIN